MHRLQRLLIIFNILLSMTNFTLCRYAAPQSPPYKVKAKAVSGTSAMVQWDAPVQPNGEILVSIIVVSTICIHSWYPEFRCDVVYV